MPEQQTLAGLLAHPEFAQGFADGAQCHQDLARGSHALSDEEIYREMVEVVSCSPQGQEEVSLPVSPMLYRLGFVIGQVAQSFERTGEEHAR